MPKHYKVSACLTVLLAVVFYLFFQICKQQPALAHVAPFTEDPYDAVGSFGTQFAVFTALLSMVRAFRPYQPNRAVDSQQVLLARGAYMTCLSVAVTLSADIVAMLRSSSVWIGFPAGYMLVALVGGMALLTALVGWLISYSTRKIIVPSAKKGWTRAMGISLVGILILALYPASWSQSIPGALLTAFTGAVLFLSRFGDGEWP